MVEELMWQNLISTYTRITTPLDTAFKREFSTIIGRIHKVDFSRPVDPMSMSGQGGSPYMQDLVDKMSFIKREILGRLSMGDFMKDWCVREREPCKVDTLLIGQGARTVPPYNHRLPTTRFDRSTSGRIWETETDYRYDRT